MKKFLLSCCLAGLIAGGAYSQAITFTGDVAADFAVMGAANVLDPGGIGDVGMPGALMGNISGWDIQGAAVSYDPMTDTLFCGIDTVGIAGDADGDGDPNLSSAGLLINGGVDQANWAGTESFTFGLDLDGDGTVDVVAGIPAGADFSGFTVAMYNNAILFPMQNPLADPYFRFGAALPANLGPAPVQPNAMFQDIEFTIPNFSALTAAISMPGQTSFGIHCFMGSQEDDGVGEDYLPAIATISIPLLPCFPIFNFYEVVGTEVLAPNLQRIDTEYGLPDGYGCCLLFSLFLNPMPFPIVSVPGQPLVGVGLTAVPGTIMVVDLGVPPSTGAPVQCKETSYFVDPTGLQGTTFYLQILAYPANNPMLTFYTSNVESFTF